MQDSEFFQDDPVEEPITLEDENLCLCIGGRIRLVGNGGLETFEPDADLDAALVEAYIKMMGRKLGE